MCVNTGVTGVTATVNYKGNTYTASYTLTVKADDASYKVSGLSCPAMFSQCCVYFLNEDCQPAYEKVMVPSAS